MTKADRTLDSRFAAMIDKWRSFWFTPEPAYSLGLVRIAFGALVVVWTSRLMPDLYSLFGDDGVVPRHPALDYRWGIFQIWSGDNALLIGWVLLLLSAIAMTVGWHSRVAAILVCVLVISFMRRDPYVFNAGDGLISVLGLYLALSSCGAALSLDQRRRTGSFWSAQCRARWPIRLLQVQLSLIYLISVQAKLSGSTWVDGSAVSYAWRVHGQWAILPAPQWLVNNSLLVNVATWGSLVIELSIAVLVWNRRWRFWVLAAGVVLHLAILVNMSVGFFTPAMFVLYLAFVPWETVQRMSNALKARSPRLRNARESAQGSTSQTDEEPGRKSQTDEVGAVEDSSGTRRS
jgi:hypothetical protein